MGIYQFVVHHVAGTLEVQDNNGDTYRGTITRPSVDYDSGTPVVDALAGGVPGDTDAGLVREIELSYPYSLSGTSGGVPVKMVGTFRIAIVVTYSYELEGGAGGFSLSVEEVFQQRTLLMQGNWIEESGRTAVIFATGPSDVVNEVLDILGLELDVEL